MPRSHWIKRWFTKVWEPVAKAKFCLRQQFCVYAPLIPSDKNVFNCDISYRNSISDRENISIPALKFVANQMRYFFRKTGRRSYGKLSAPDCVAAYTISAGLRHGGILPLISKLSASRMSVIGVWRRLFMHRRRQTQKIWSVGNRKLFCLRQWDRLD